MRPPMISPMPAGVAVVSVNRAIVVAEKPANIVEIAVLEEDGRRDEQVGEEGDRREDDEPTTVERRRR